MESIRKNFSDEIWRVFVCPFLDRYSKLLTTEQVNNFLESVISQINALGRPDLKKGVECVREPLEAIIAPYRIEAEKTLEKEKIRETLVACIETSTTALMVLENAPNYGDKDFRMSEVAGVLRKREVPIPREFPGSYGCVKYGKRIAEHLMKKTKRYTGKEIKAILATVSDDP